MGGMSPRAVRLSRGALLGGVATALAAASHLAGGGPTPSPVALALGAVFATTVGTVAVGRMPRARVSLPRTLAGVAISQLAFHLVFSMLGTGARVAADGGHRHALVSLAADPGAAVAQGGAGMWAAHLIAGVLTVLYLRHLERRAWAALARLGGMLTRAIRPLALLPLAAPRPAAEYGAWAPSVSALRDAIARRGPPLTHRA